MNQPPGNDHAGSSVAGKGGGANHQPASTRRKSGPTDGVKPRTSRVTIVPNPKATESADGWVKPLAPGFAVKGASFPIPSPPTLSTSSSTTIPKNNGGSHKSGLISTRMSNAKSPSTTNTRTSAIVADSNTSKSKNVLNTISRFKLALKRAATRRRSSHGSSKPTPICPIQKEKELYTQAPSSQWTLIQDKFAGAYTFDTMGRNEVIDGQSIQEAIQRFHANPDKYIALMYQSNMETWTTDRQSYTLIHREGSLRLKPQAMSPQGWMTLLFHHYQPLPSLPKNQLPTSACDAHSDHMVHRQRPITNFILPGRGMGVGDTPLLKIIGNVDPSDIRQGHVGDCWLLSAISALAEFDGAIQKLFRKNKQLHEMPRPEPNTYIITLWDLPTWTEVDIVIDERLAATPDGSGKLLGAGLSKDGELWVSYLEKAVAVHCGGWDKITGGQCVHGWAMLTGNREQFTIRKTPETGKYGCYAKYNAHLGQWDDHVNSPQDHNKGRMWRVPWPKVGGGGGIRLELNEDELFDRLFAYDQENYIVAAGTNGTSDANLTEGMVDNHAYSVIEAVGKVAGTNVDLFKVRNPWGRGEIENGEFDDDGPGWTKYPQIKALLNPVDEDDGIFWLTKQEFFRFFDHIYVSASSMTAFLED